MAVEAGTTASEAYGVSAGLDLLSGVFGYLASEEAASVARSRADLVRIEAEANAQRYAEQAAQFEAHEKVMYLASGVKLSGSPVDALATTARVASENMAAIRMAGEAGAQDDLTRASNDEAAGRATLVEGFDKSVGMGINSYSAAHGGSKNNPGLGALADMLGGK